MQNLRSVLAQVNRGGRSMGSRNFSSPPGISNGLGARGRVFATGGLKSLVQAVVRESTFVGLLSSSSFGYACYIVSELVVVRKESQAAMEESRLRRKRLSEIGAKRKGLLRDKGIQKRKVCV